MVDDRVPKALLDKRIGMCPEVIDNEPAKDPRPDSEDESKTSLDLEPIDGVHCGQYFCVNLFAPVAHGVKGAPPPAAAAKMSVAGQE
jgi:hypothetical protein